MFCKYCGKEMDDNAAFCPYCGKSQEVTPDPGNGSQTARQQAPQTRLNARILKTLEQEFQIDPDREIRNFTSFHSAGYRGGPTGLAVSVLLICIVNGVEIATNVRHPAINYLLWFVVLAFAVWEIILVMRIFRSAFGITDTRLLVRIWPSQKHEILLDQIENVSVRSRPYGRSGVYGDLQITTKEQTYYFKSISNVEGFQNTLEQQINERK